MKNWITRTWISTNLFVLSVALLILVSVDKASAQSNCGPFIAITERLHAQYGEMPFGSGLTQGGGELVIFQSIDGSTWSIVVLGEGGIGCLVSHGTNFTTKSQGLPT